VRSIVVVTVLSLAAGCKDKPAKQEPPATTGSGSAATKSDGKRVPAPDLVLPRGDGTPPKKTTKPLTKPDFERLSKLEFPGFTLDVRNVGVNVLELRQKTQDHPRLWAVVTIKPCFECLPMDLATWKAKEADLRALNLEVLKDSPDIEWELGETELNGQKVIYTYQVGLGQRNSPGGVEFSFTNNLYAYYNDGVNEIRVAAMYKDDPANKDELKKRAPKEQLRALALAFMDVYTHAW
jgi:hypothetical protein